VGELVEHVEQTRSPDDNASGTTVLWTPDMPPGIWCECLMA
jgi:hypothetical protein